MMNTSLDTLAHLFQTATETRDTFAWLGTAADILAILSAAVAVFAWSRARKAATEAQEAVRGLRERIRRIETYAAAVDLSRELRELIAAQEARQWQAALVHYGKIHPLIVQVRGGNIRLLSEAQRRKLIVASMEITELANTIATALHVSPATLADLDAARYNTVVGEIADTVEEIIVVLHESA